MSDRRVTEPKIHHLEWLFTPMGFVVPKRIADAAPTTSVLVRGGAGTGKTTLALGIAATLAEAADERIYYLSTEIAGTDIRFKLPHIGLAPQDAGPLRGDERRPKVLTEHILQARPEPLDEPGQKTLAALERIQNLVLDHEIQGLRVVIIDAFSLVGETDAVKGDRSPSKLRARLVETIQAFDMLGVSVVLVEEAPVVGADWASFVVDYVFELGWGEDPDTRMRYRQLSVPKSRFVPAAYGPHDYGLEEGRVAVWPDITAVDRALLAPRREPLLLDGELGLIRGMVGSAYEGTSSVANAIGRLPWIPTISASLAGFPTIASLTISIGAGPNRFLWGLIQQIESQAAEIVVITGTRLALSRVRWGTVLFGGLQAISASGVIVVLHDRQQDLEQVPASFDYATGSRGTRAVIAKTWLAQVRHGPPLAQQLWELFGHLKRSSASASAYARYALIVAVALRDGRTASLGVTNSTDPADLPLLRHALARCGRMDEALQHLGTDDPAERELLTAELHLNLFTPEGLVFAEPVYDARLADPSFPEADKELLRAQLAEVRAALASP